MQHTNTDSRGCMHVHLSALLIPEHLNPTPDVKLEVVFLQAFAVLVHRATAPLELMSCALTDCCLAHNFFSPTLQTVLFQKLARVVVSVSTFTCLCFWGRWVAV